MALTEQQVKIISEFPLKNGLLDHVRDSLFDNVDNLQEQDIVNLLGVLVGSSAAFRLPSPDGNGDVAGKLFLIQRNVRHGAAKLDQFRPLVRHVVANSPDIDIWAAVFTLIANIHPSTPPHSSIAPTFRGTPIKPNSSRLANTETREIVEGELFEEIKKCTFRNVSGFWDKFFDSKCWQEEQKAMLEGILTTHNGEIWTDFPSIPYEKEVWEWLCKLKGQFLGQAPFNLDTTRNPNEFQERKGQMDLFFEKSAAEDKHVLVDGDQKKSYKHVLVVGEQKLSYNRSRFKADFLQLTRHVRSVFASQPTRRFAHAFSLCASKMELWVFDRSGAYSSGTFDIHHEPDKFARALVGYSTMGDDVMGLDTFMERQDEHRYVTLDNANGEEVRLQLDKAMVRQKAIVCRGTTCYETQNSHVAKFSWASDKRKLEVDQLRLAEAMGVEGVARVVAYRRITTIAEMREGLQFSAAHRFRGGGVYSDDTSSNTNTSSKRNSSSNHTSDASVSKKRKSSQKSNLVTVLKNQLSIGKTKPSLYTPGEDLWENRIYSCLVVSPAGRVISEFRTIKELLESERDAIKAHRSLYTKGKILHRDISSNNIIITNPDAANGFKGMLIDLDLAKVLDSEPSGARHRTGTMQFMAVEVLLKTDHTYRHDLESFFYVLLWMCARQAWSSGFAGKQLPPKESLLRRWEIGSFKYIAANKEGDMTIRGLERIMGEFPEALDVVKPLCLSIRTTLFGDPARQPAFGTPAGDPDQLYKPIIAAFDEAVNKLNKL